MASLQFRRLFSSSRTGYILLATVVVIGMFALTRVAAMPPDVNQKSPEELIKEARERLVQRKMNRIEVYYYDWGVNTQGGISKNDLLTRYHYKVTIANPLGNFSDLAEALGHMRLRRLKSESTILEFQLACVFYSGDAGHLGLFFCGDAPILSINDSLFEADPALLHAITAFLPHEAYEQMYRDVLYQWAYHLRTQFGN